MKQLEQKALCPIVIGRASYLEALQRFVAAVAAVDGAREHTLLIAGEAGVGKSRLVAETKHYAHKTGLLTVQGHCFETDRSLPYAQRPGRRARPA